MIAERLNEIRSRVATAALRYGRRPESVTLLAVSKQQPHGAIRELARAGQREFGESYLQEALPKIGALRELNLQWHYIGQIQSNKTRSIAEHFEWVHTVDRLKIAERLNEQRKVDSEPLNVCVQVKLAEEAGKGGVAPEATILLAKQIASLPQLRLRGLMCIPPPRDTFEEQFAYFTRTAELFDKLRRGGADIDTLSMGMSGDLDAAIAAGATIVRVGTAIFGERTKEATGDW